MLVGKSDFSGGVTTLGRVSVESRAILGVCSGFDPSDGTLVPERVVGMISRSGLGGELPMQTPFGFVDGATLRLIARDKDARIRELVGDAWGSAGDVVGLVSESIPARMGDQVIYSTAGSSAKIVAYEPGSPSTKTRPLSLKSPGDYVQDTKVLVTPSANTGVQLFGCEADSSTYAWKSNDASASVSSGVNTATLSITETAPISTVLFKKNLPADVSLVGKSYLVMDIAISGDPQKYTDLGLFANDPAMQSSGYELVLYGSSGLVDSIVSMPIPQIMPDGMVNRVAFRLPSAPAHNAVRSIGIRTTSFFTKPATGNTFQIFVYSQFFADDWSQIGNFLVGGIVWSKAPWAQVLNQDSGNGQSYVPPASNLVVNGDFESLVTAPWTFSGRAELCGGHMGLNSVGMKGDDWATQDDIPVSAGNQYKLSWWARDDNNSRRFVVSIQPMDALGNSVGSVIRYPDTGAAGPGTTWTSYSKQFTVPSGSTRCKITFRHDGSSDYHWIFVDDVSLTPVDTTASGSAWILQTFSADGKNKTPGSSFLRYAYVFCGMNLLGNPNYKNMISNPCYYPDWGQFADPWRTYNLSIELPEDEIGATVISEYGNYVTHALVYRQIYDGETGVWSSFSFVQAVPIGTAMSYSDEGYDAEAMVNSLSVPSEMEITNDYASSARYAMVADHRVYAGCLDWDDTLGKWRRPTAIEVSGYEKPWAFATVVDENSQSTDGGELDGYAVTGSEIRGIIARADEKYVFLDNEFFLLKGDSPISGWQFTRLDSIGCQSARTLADCRSMIIWHAGDHFYAYSGGLARPISRFCVDSSAIDWNAPHNAVYWRDNYVFYCSTLEGHRYLMIYDITSGAWRVRESDALEMVGICTDSASGRIYGITPAGDAVDVFGSGGSDGALQSTVREVWTQYLRVGDSSHDVQVSDAVLEVVTGESGGIDLDLTFETQGAKNGTATRVLHVEPDRTRYHVGLNMQCNAIRIGVQYTGVTPPTIYSLGVLTDEVAIR